MFTVWIGRVLATGFILLAASCSQPAEEAAQSRVAWKEAACAAHGAPASVCFFCDESLRDPGRLWCRGHNTYEDRCWDCHPEARDPDRLYCREHRLYEDECFLCHPEAAAALQGEPGGHQGHGHGTPDEQGHALFCNEHGVMERECGICQPTLADSLIPGQGLKIRFLSAEAGSKAGVQAILPEPLGEESGLPVVGEVIYNQNRLARITPTTDGVIRRVYADLGQSVLLGDILADISSPAIAEGKSNLLVAEAREALAKSVVDREEDLFNKNVASEQRLFEARTSYQAAKAERQAAEQVLLNMGLTRGEVVRVVEDQDGSSVVPLRAPFAGTVIARDAVLGDVVGVGEPLFSIADTREMWVKLALTENDVAKLRLGQVVNVSPRSLPLVFRGEISWIATELSEQTRMANVRVEVSNPEGLLRAGMFVDARVQLYSNDDALALPRDAVHYFGGNPFVFVQLAPDLYELRRVVVGSQGNGHISILSGLGENDLVASSQSYLVKSEFQKSRLGAGCTD